MIEHSIAGMRRTIMENSGFLFAAFAIVWILLFGFVLLLFSRQRKLRDEIDALGKSLKEGDSE